MESIFVYGTHRLTNIIRRFFPKYFAKTAKYRNYIYIFAPVN